MNNKELAKLLEYSSSKSIFIVTWNNELRQLFCPFRVILINSVGLLEKGKVAWVDEVKITLELKMVYIINGTAYYYYHFNILNNIDRF